MWLILTEPYDETGPWLAQGLRANAPCPVLHFTTREFSHGASSAHGQDEMGPWFHVRLASGQTIDSRSLRGVVNRVCALPPSLASRLSHPHRDLAEKNFGLPLMRHLHGYEGPVLNRPTAQGISGDFRLDFEWAALAAQVGLLRIPPRRGWQTTTSVRCPYPDVTSVAVIGDEVIPLPPDAPQLPAAIVASCRRLALLSRTNLLGLDFTRGVDGEWFFLRANPRANLVSGGERVLSAVLAILSRPPEAKPPAPRFLSTLHAATPR